MRNERTRIGFRHEPDGAVIVRHPNGQQEVDQPPCDGAAYALEPPALALLLVTVNHIVLSLLQFINKSTAELGGFFKIDIDKKHVLAARVLETRHHCFMMTKISRQLDNTQLGIERDKL